MAGLTFSLATSYSDNGKAKEDKERLEQNLIELAQTALRCGKKEVRKLPNERGIDHVVDVYTIGNPLPPFKYGDTYLFQFFDGSATTPTGKVDSGDRFQIANYSTSIWGPLPFLDEDTSGLIEETARKLPAIIEYVQNNLPKECYQKKDNFNCC